VGEGFFAARFKKSLLDPTMNASQKDYSCFVLLNFIAENVSRETFLPKKRTKSGTCEI